MFMYFRGIWNLTDQISLINPDPMMNLNSLYSKNWKLTAQTTSYLTLNFGATAAWNSAMEFFVTVTQNFIVTLNSPRSLREHTLSVPIFNKK